MACLRMNGGEPAALQRPPDTRARGYRRARPSHGRSVRGMAPKLGMANSPENPLRFRIVDLEASGTTPNDAVVEIGAVDLLGGEIVIIGSDLVRPPVPIPPQASAIHHITDRDVAHCPQVEEILPFYMDGDGERMSTCSSLTSGPLRPSGLENTSRAALLFAPTRRRSGFGRKLLVTAIRSCGTGSGQRI